MRAAEDDSDSTSPESGHGVEHRVSVSAFVDIPAGRLEVLDLAGDPNEPPLVLLHEGLGSVGRWRSVPQRLQRATGLRTIAFSRFGHGRSDPPPRPRAPLSLHEEEARDVLPAVLGKLEVERPILVGHSDGGSIALIYAGGVRRHRARGIVTLAAHVFNEKVCVDSIAAAGEAYRDTDLRERLVRYHGANVDDAFWGWNRVWLSPEFWRWNIEEFLPPIEVPVLAIQGWDDEYGTERQVDSIVAKVGASAEKLMLDRCKHSPHKDQPEATLDAATRFVAGLVP